MVLLLTSVDIQEIVKNGGKVNEIYEALIYRENFRKSPSRKLLKSCLLQVKNIK